MIEIAIKCGVFLAVYLGIFAGLASIPVFSSLISQVTGQTDVLFQAVSAFANLLGQYVHPFTAFLSHMLSPWVWGIVVDLIVWSLIKRFVYWTFDFSGKIALYLIEKM